LLFLLVTLVVDGLGALALSWCNVITATSLLGTLGSVFLLAIAAANLWALNAALRAGHSWARDSVIAQLSVLLAASYFLWHETRSLIKLNWTTVAVDWMNWTRLGAPPAKIAILVALIAAGWILFLWGRATVKWTTTSVTVAAVVGLAGFLQFWLQNYYIPQAQMPQVDLSVDLSQQGRSGPVTHLSAKVTIHNRGTVPVEVAGALMRVIAYTPAPQQRIDQRSWDQQCQGDLRFSAIIHEDYRANPILAESAQLIYAGYFMNGPEGFLTPGETDTVVREVDLPANFSFARLSATAVFYNDRQLKERRPCEAYRPDNSGEEAIPSAANGHFYCVEYEFAPTNVIERIIAERPVIRVWVITDAENTGREYPRIDWSEGTAYDPAAMVPDPDLISMPHFSEKYPADSDTDVSAEYAVSDAPPGGGR
jgi:hypothetical protein